MPSGSTVSTSGTIVTQGSPSAITASLPVPTLVMLNPSLSTQIVEAITLSQPTLQISMLPYQPIVPAVELLNVLPQTPPVVEHDTVLTPLDSLNVNIRSKCRKAT